MEKKNVEMTTEEFINYQVEKISEGRPIDVINIIVINMIFKDCDDEQIVNYVIDTFTSCTLKTEHDIKSAYPSLLDVACVLCANVELSLEKLEKLFEESQNYEECTKEQIDKLGNNIIITKRMIKIYKEVARIIGDRINN